MESFFKMDVFFVVATVATLVLASLLAILLWYLIQIVRSCKRILQVIENESENIRADIADMRLRAKQKGATASRLIDMILSVGKKIITRAGKFFTT